jgi:hypothetical protein
MDTVSTLHSVETADGGLKPPRQVGLLVITVGMIQEWLEPAEFMENVCRKG